MFHIAVILKAYQHNSDFREIQHYFKLLIYCVCNRHGSNSSAHCFTLQRLSRNQFCIHEISW